MQNVTRRDFIRVASISGLALSSVGMGAGQAWGQRIEEIHRLKAGQYTWHPDRSPEGPVAIIVSLPDQLVHVYRNGVRIGVSTCSTGRPGHSTPTGVFLILQKDKHHHSSKYNNAPMPNMNRITWSGVALHAGHLPGYPASHGCIRLPSKFSEDLFGVTHVGTPVIVSGSHSDPKEVVHPGLVLSSVAEQELEAAVAKKLKKETLPWAATVVDVYSPTSVVISGADKSVYVLADGSIVAQGNAYIKNPSTPLGSHVFMLVNAREGRKGLVWHGIGHNDQTNGAISDAAAVIPRITSDKPVIDAISQRMHPGMVLLTTDLPAHPDTRTGKDFVVMTAETR